MERFHCLALVLLFCTAVGAKAGWNNLNCPAPRAPENGLSFIFRNGELVHFRCHPGYFMRGKAIAHCVHNQWSDPSPECISISGYQEFRSATSFHSTHPKEKPHKHTPHHDEKEAHYETDSKANRPLFNWGDDSKHSNSHSTTNAPYGDGPRRLPLINGLWRPPEARVLTIAPQPVPLRTSVSPFIKPSNLMKEEVDIAELRHRQMEEVLKARVTESHKNVTSSRPEKKRRRQKKDRKKQNAVLVDSKDSENSQAHSTVSFGSSDGTEITISYSIPNNGTAPEKVKHGRHKYRHDEQKRRRKGKKRKWNTPGPHLISRTSRVEMVRHRPSYTSYSRRPEYEVAEFRHRPVEVTRGHNSSSQQNDSNSIYFTHEFDTSCVQTIYGHEVPMISPQIPHAFVYRYETRRNKNYPYNSYLQVKYRCLLGFTLENPKLNSLYCRQVAWVGHVPKCIVKTDD